MSQSRLSEAIASGERAVNCAVLSLLSYRAFVGLLKIAVFVSSPRAVDVVFIAAVHHVLTLLL
jgi:hypothetical protein